MSLNNLTPAAQLIKGAILCLLEQQGVSPKKAEDALLSKEAATCAVIEKTALGLADLLSVAGGAAQLGIGGAVGVGGVAGLGAFGAYKGFENSRNKVEESDAVKRRVDLARKELEAMYLSQHAGQPQQR